MHQKCLKVYFEKCWCCSTMYHYFHCSCDLMCGLVSCENYHFRMHEREGALNIHVCSDWIHTHESRTTATLIGDDDEVQCCSCIEPKSMNLVIITNRYEIHRFRNRYQTDKYHCVLNVLHMKNGVQNEKKITWSLAMFTNEPGVYLQTIIVIQT